MSKFAKIDENNKVIQVIEATIEYVNSGELGNPNNFIETNVMGLRKVYAAIGYTYNKEHDIFILPQPYSSWTLDENFDWQPPISQPEGNYSWNEQTQTWDLVINE